MSSTGMDRMLMCFERDAINWLRQVKTEFNSINQQFDENFRLMFIQTATDRYVDAYLFGQSSYLDEPSKCSGT